MPNAIMRIAGFEFRPNVVPSIVAGALLMLLLSLGTWQLNRAEQKQALLTARDSGKAASALDLNLNATPQGADRYRPATVKGRYRADQQWLLDNRVFKGRAGYHVYTLLETANPNQGTLLVNRGWIDAGPSRTFLPDVPAPDGLVELSGRLDLPESVALKLDNDQLASIAPVVVVQHLDLAELKSSIGRELLPFALVLDDGQPGVLQRDWSESPGMTPQKHVGYAVQWFALAVALLIIYVGVNTRRVDVSEHN
jgi:surfeit locus 1 family protein